jgi:hypothetical protein
MKTTIITCDICKREMHQRGWEAAPQRLIIVTNCTSQNPMERITKNSQFQANTFVAEDVCQKCMKSLAKIIADGIESLANIPSAGNPDRERT